MNRKPETCPICGSSWLAEMDARRLECLGCGARALKLRVSGRLVAVEKYKTDAIYGPVALTRNHHFMSEEAQNRLLDDLGLPPETP